LIKKMTNLYIIITNSLQNDFIETRFIKQIKKDANEDLWKIDYDTLAERWIEYFRDRDILPEKLNINNFLDDLREIKSKDIKYSYHKFLNYYNHRVHVDIQQTEKLWNDERLPKFISHIMQRSAEANERRSGEVYDFIHLRDWHDPTDAGEREELCNFGYHCIKGSHGAHFIHPLDDYIEKYDTFNHIINSNSLSSFSDTKLKSILDTIRINHKVAKEDVKIGIFGVITNIKLKLLAFELKVVHNFENVYLCEELSAGFNEKGHNDGLKYMKNVLGVSVYSETKFKEEFNLP